MIRCQPAIASLDKSPYLLPNYRKGFRPVKILLHFHWLSLEGLGPSWNFRKNHSVLRIASYVPSSRNVVHRLTFPVCIHRTVLHEILCSTRRYMYLYQETIRSCKTLVFVVQIMHILNLLLNIFFKNRHCNSLNVFISKHRPRIVSIRPVFHLSKYMYSPVKCLQVFFISKHTHV